MAVPGCPPVETEVLGSLEALPGELATEEGAVEGSTLARICRVEPLVPVGAARLLGASILSTGLGPSTARVRSLEMPWLGTPLPTAPALVPGSAGLSENWPSELTPVLRFLDPDVRVLASTALGAERSDARLPAAVAASARGLAEVFALGLRTAV
jgi:hypothetical protein